MQKSAGSPASRDLVETVAQGLVEDRYGAIDLVGRYRQGRCDPPHRAALRAASDVHAEAELEAFPGRERAQFVVRPARLAVLHQLDAEQEAFAADIADRLVALLQFLE